MGVMPQAASLIRISRSDAKAPPPVQRPIDGQIAKAEKYGGVLIAVQLPMTARGTPT
jgi:hypothetical protein